MVYVSLVNATIYLNSIGEPNVSNIETVLKFYPYIHGKTYTQ